MDGNTEIVKKVIEKALDNGWKHTVIHKIWDGDKPISSIDFAVRESLKHMDLLVGTFLQNPTLFFDHELAKAFWGETETTLAWYAENIDERPYSFEKGFTWQVHLMRMVLEEDPIQYLAKFL